MRFLRFWRQYDSIKAAVLLFTLAAYLVGYCIHAAMAYAALMQTPTEYICTVENGFDSIVTRLMQQDNVKGYSRQKTVNLVQNDKTLNVAQLSAAYLSDVYGITENAHIIWANDTTFTIFCGDTDAQSAQIQGTLDGKLFSSEIMRTDALPDDPSFAVMSVNVFELHDAVELRICMTEPNVKAIEQLGLSILNKDTIVAAEYEQKLVLLRIRFGILSVILCCIAASALLRIFRIRIKGNQDALNAYC